jgi:hypothetical protein
VRGRLQASDKPPTVASARVRHSSAPLRSTSTNTTWLRWNPHMCTFFVRPYGRLGTLLDTVAFWGERQTDAGGGGGSE